MNYELQYKNIKVPENTAQEGNLETVAGQSVLWLSQNAIQAKASAGSTSVDRQLCCVKGSLRGI